MSTFQELGVDVTLTEVLSGRNISSPFEVQVAAIPLNTRSYNGDWLDTDIMEAIAKSKGIVI